MAHGIACPEWSRKRKLLAAARHQKDPRGWFLQVILGTWLVGYAGYAFSGGTFRVQRRAVETEGEKAEKLWTLEVGCTDHYVWKDKDVFVGIVADAGEWTVDLDAVRNGFEEACDKGTAEIFSAPLHVVKAYVKELTSYGLAARAKEATGDVEGGGYQRRDFKDLSPELKEGAREDGVLEAEASGKPLQIVLEKSDHPCLSGEKKAMSKFKAYVELATDAAQRWLPPENEVNQCYVKLVEQGKAVLLKSLTAEAAQRALEQLTASGFVAKAAEREEQRRVRESSDRDAQAAFEEEKQKAVERKKKEKENADFLQQQINQKTMEKRAKEQMTEVEQAMNKDRLDRAKKPETLQMVAQHKLRQVGAAANRGA